MHKCLAVKEVRLLIIVSAVAAIIATGCTAPRNVTKQEMPSPPVPQIDTVALGLYSAQIARTSNPPYIDFWKDKKRVYKETCAPGDTISVLDRRTGSKMSPSPATLNGLSAPAGYLVYLADGKLPAAIIQCKSAEGTSKYLIFRLGDTVSKIATIPVGYGSLSLEDAGDNSHEMLANDWYSAWGATQIAPEVLLKWNGKTVVLDTEGMKYRPPLASEIASLKEELAPQFDSLPASDDPIGLAPPELASQVFALYYAGQGKYATKLFDACWPANHAGKKAYWEFLMKQLRHSPYWSQLEAFNKS